jgi:hypothetical protein
VELEAVNPSDLRPMVHRNPCYALRGVGLRGRYDVLFSMRFQAANLVRGQSLL